MKQIMKFKVNAKIYAILFSTNIKVFDIQLHSGFNVVKKSLVPEIDHLDKVYNMNQEELFRQYHTAKIDDMRNVSCAYKEIDLLYSEQAIGDVLKKIENQVNNHITNELNILDKQLRLIRLLTESAIRFKNFLYVGNIKISNETIGLDDSFSFNIFCPNTIPEAYAITSAFETFWDSDSISLNAGGYAPLFRSKDGYVPNFNLDAVSPDGMKVAGFSCDESGNYVISVFTRQ